MMDLSNKHIVITGASQGIGQATAILANQKGARVSLISRSSDKLEQVCSSLEGDANRVYPYDLNDLQGIETLTKKIVQEQGSIDGLVHCAGIAPLRPLNLLKPEFLHSVMTINFFSFIELVRCIGKGKNFNQGLSVVSVSSVRSHVGGKSETAYSASKAALDAATRSLAKELSSKSIRVNTVVAGLVKTSMHDELVNNIGLDAVNSQTGSRQYLGLGEPDDVANAICYLLSDSSKFITGTGLVVDGGYLS